MKRIFNSRGLFVLTLGLLAGACSDSSSGVSEVTNTGAAILQATAGTGQAALVGANVAVAPAVVVKDGSGKGLPGLTVRFTVTAGGGSVTNSTATTDASGTASAGAWKLGTTPGANVVEAAVGKLAPVQFTATATTAVAPPPAATGAYSITIRYTEAPSARQQQAVSAAVARWQSVITRDLMDIPVNAPANSCWDGQPAINERVDDILIFVEIVDIDGAGKVLGEAGPCYVRSDNQLPIIGHLKLDAADLRQMESYGTLNDVVLHEIGHVLGIGTMWADKGLLQGKGLDDPQFLGANAVSAFRLMGGAEAGVPVENTGGDGTRDGHWRETTFGNELMTGWVSGATNPLSALTIASLADMGYGANTGAASTYTLGSRAGSFMAAVQLNDEIIEPKFKIDRSGKRYPIE